MKCNYFIFLTTPFRHLVYPAMSSLVIIRVQYCLDFKDSKAETISSKDLSIVTYKTTTNVRISVTASDDLFKLIVQPLMTQHMTSGK